MRAVDTNVLVRLITRDDAQQVASADRFVEKGAWVSHLVLAETAWVLAAVYERSAAETKNALSVPWTQALAGLTSRAIAIPTNMLRFPMAYLLWCGVVGASDTPHHVRHHER